MSTLTDCIELPNGMKFVLNDAGLGSNICFFIHGTGDGAFVWHDIMKILASGNRTISIDLRGHGYSDWSPDGHYDTDHYVDDLHHIFSKMEMRPITLIGHSMGADIAIRLAGARPDLVRYLIVLDFAPDINSNVIPHMDAVARSDHIIYASPEAYAHRMQLRLPLAELSTIRSFAIAALQADSSGFRLRRDPVVIEGDNSPKPELWHILAKLQMPTLILRGFGSAVVSSATAEKMARVVPRATYMTVPMAGHALMLDNPKAVALAIESFLKNAGS